MRRALDSHGIQLFDCIPIASLDQRFVLFRSTDLMHAQRGDRVLTISRPGFRSRPSRSAWARSPARPRRRRTIEYLAVGVAGVMVVIAVGAAVGHAYYLARVGAVYRTDRGRALRHVWSVRCELDPVDAS